SGRSRVRELSRALAEFSGRRHEALFNHFQDSLGHNRTNTVTDLTKTVPLCWSETKPIWESLKPRSFTRRNHAVLKRMNRSHRLITSAILCGAGAQCWARAGRVE